MPGQAPAQQRLGTDDAPVAQVDLRLVAHHELFTLDRAPQLALEHQPLDRGGVHLRRVERIGVAAVLLGVVHRRIGVADQIDDVLGVAMAERDADAHGKEQLLLVDVEGLAGRVQHRARQLRDRAVGRRRSSWLKSVDEQRELVARESAEHRLAVDHLRVSRSASSSSTRSPEA